MSRRPQLLKLLTSERDALFDSAIRWMLLLRVVFPPSALDLLGFFVCFFFVVVRGR